MVLTRGQRGAGISRSLESYPPRAAPSVTCVVAKLGLRGMTQ